jgi:hypothetical protein
LCRPARASNGDTAAHEALDGLGPRTIAALEDIAL